MDESSGSPKARKTVQNGLLTATLDQKTIDALGPQHIANILLSILAERGLKEEAVEALKSAAAYLDAKEGS